MYGLKNGHVSCGLSVRPKELLAKSIVDYRCGRCVNAWAFSLILEMFQYVMLCFCSSWYTELSPLL